MKYHYLEKSLASTQHKITIDLIGAGGTGSHMLTNLAVLSATMISLGRQPLFVRSFDPDKIEPHNVGRQMFSKSDVGQFKSDVLITRANRYFGTDWQSYSVRYEESKYCSNIIISCVDSVASRKEIYFTMQKHKHVGSHYNVPFYWMDIGNSRKSGQIILGTVSQIPQPSNCGAVEKLATFVKEFKRLKEDMSEPTCSLAESLSRQDLFINKIMATYASNMLWQLLSEFRISYRGIYVNLETMKTQPILL